MRPETKIDQFCLLSFLLDPLPLQDYYYLESTYCMYCILRNVCILRSQTRSNSVWIISHTHELTQMTHMICKQFGNTHLNLNTFPVCNPAHH